MEKVILRTFFTRSSNDVSQGSDFLGSHSHLHMPGDSSEREIFIDMNDLSSLLERLEVPRETSAQAVEAFKKSAQGLPTIVDSVPFSTFYRWYHQYKYHADWFPSSLSEPQENTSQELANRLQVCLEIIVRVLVLRVAPKKYWVDLLEECIPLLERGGSQNVIAKEDKEDDFSKGGIYHGEFFAVAEEDDEEEEQVQPVLSASDTYQLMACLQELDTSHRKHLVPVNPKKVAAIRMTLLRNLSKAVKHQSGLW